MTLPEHRGVRAASNTPSYSSLAALSAVASGLNSGQSVDVVIPRILDAIRGQLGSEECVLWGDTANGYAPRWISGAHTPEAWSIAEELAGGQIGDAGTRIVVPLDSPQRRIGALSLRRSRAFLPEEHVLMVTIGNLLTPFLTSAEHSELLAAEIELRTRQIEEQRKFTSLIIDSLPVGLYVIDSNYKIQAWNKKRETGMQGVARQDAMGRPIFEILHRQTPGALRDEFDEIFSTGKVQQFHTESNAPGQSRVYRVSKIPMRMDGGPVSHVITIGEDVTEWKEAMDRISQADKLAGIGQLAAGVMHEINNPLATIAACAESLSLLVTDMRSLGYAMNKQFAEYLTIIDSEVQRCKRIVDSLLEFSHPRAMTKEFLVSDDIVDQTLFLLKHHVKFKQITIARELHSGGRGRISANRDQMVQVFMALLINAVDAMGERGRLLVRSRIEGNGNTVVVTEVVDEGHGLAKPDIPRIFEPFYTTKGPGRGTGLGLSICYAIINEHGGRVEVDSAPGRGSVFRVVLPVVQE